MLIPKRVKHRKWQRGRGKARRADTRGLALEYGSYGLKAMTHGVINSRQIEAVRRTISNYTKREGQVFIRIFPDKPMTARPPEVTMGGGKGSVDHYIFDVLPGRILFEMDGVTKAVAMEALRLAGHKLPMRTKILTKED